MKDVLCVSDIQLAILFLRIVSLPLDISVLYDPIFVEKIVCLAQHPSVELSHTIWGCLNFITNRCPDKSFFTQFKLPTIILNCWNHFNEQAQVYASDFAPRIFRDYGTNNEIIRLSLKILPTIQPFEPDSPLLLQVIQLASAFLTSQVLSSVSQTLFTFHTIITKTPSSSLNFLSTTLPFFIEDGQPQENPLDNVLLMLLLETSTRIESDIKKSHMLTHLRKRRRAFERHRGVRDIVLLNPIESRTFATLSLEVISLLGVANGILRLLGTFVYHRGECAQEFINKNLLRAVYHLLQVLQTIWVPRSDYISETEARLFSALRSNHLPSEWDAFPELLDESDDGSPLTAEDELAEAHFESQMKVDPALLIYNCKDNILQTESEAFFLLANLISDHSIDAVYALHKMAQVELDLDSGIPLSQQENGATYVPILNLIKSVLETNENAFGEIIAFLYPPLFESDVFTMTFIAEGVVECLFGNASALMDAMTDKTTADYVFAMIDRLLTFSTNFQKIKASEGLSVENTAYEQLMEADILTTLTKMKTYPHLKRKRLINDNVELLHKIQFSGGNFS
ncbi:hypothetical protein BLNAU_10371 [Blattamonas nauphoetae]|uniref:Uncharacterized protein n=1 Tax=Blattamonas nauphoetae TaxID=2049346 RepID=A0ABQ9XTB1_9EUKA|nr:hypothetical protein BLNAU_10371 [Blattamonas nauphoetae]